jgi:hypothetical protein
LISAFTSLGKHEPPYPAPGIQEVVTNARVAADALAHIFDVGAQLLGQVGQLVHEADAGGQHGIGGVFGQLGAADVHHDQAVVVALEGCVQCAHVQRCLLVVAADHDPVGLHEVVDGGAFLQELGVGHHTERRVHAAFGQLFVDRGLDGVGRADRHRALVDHHLVVGHVAADVAGGGRHVFHVCRAILVGRRAHRDELDGAEVGRALHVGGEVQPAGGHIATHHVLQAGLVDRDAAVFQDLDLGGVQVQAQHIVADLGQAGARDQADITGADDSDFHAIPGVKNVRVTKSDCTCSPGAGKPASCSKRAIFSVPRPLVSI